MAYKKLVLAAHPDKGGLASDFRAIVMAYNVLSDPEQRAEYDGGVARVTPANGSDEAFSRAPSNVDQLTKDAYARFLLTEQSGWTRLMDATATAVIENLVAALDERAKDGHRQNKRRRDVLACQHKPRSRSRPPLLQPSRDDDKPYQSDQLLR